MSTAIITQRAVRSNPFDDPAAHLSLAEAHEFETLVAALRTRPLAPREHTRLANLNARARPPLYTIPPKGAA